MPSSSVAHRARPRVLLADDDDELRILLATVLSREGYDVIEVSDGTMLLDYMRRVCLDPGGDQPALIISDICMPERSGLDAVQTLRHKAVQTPVVLMTAFPENDALDSARKLGKTVLLSKPIDLEDLRSIVFDMIETS